MTARRASGFTILEVVVTTAVVGMAVLGLLGALASGSALRAGARETEAATRAAAAVFAAIESTPAAAVVATFSGAGFDVPGLEPIAVTTVGRVTLHLDELAIPEDAGGPRDLNADNGGTPDDVDASGAGTAARFRILPVTLTLRWRGATGERTETFRALLRPGSGP